MLKSALKLDWLRFDGFFTTNRNITEEKFNANVRFTKWRDNILLFGGRCTTFNHISINNDKS